MSLHTESRGWLNRATFSYSHNYEVSATPCTENETAHAPSNGVAETLLHEPAGRESSYGDLVMVVVGRDRVRSSPVAGGDAIRTIGRECTSGALHLLQVAQIFDSVYFLMLQILAFSFSSSADRTIASRASAVAIELMTTVLRPLGDALTTLPSGLYGLNAGPAFGLIRFVNFPSNPDCAFDLMRERLKELATATT